MKKFVVQKQTLGLPYLTSHGYSCDIRRAKIFAEVKGSYLRELKENTGARHDAVLLQQEKSK